MELWEIAHSGDNCACGAEKAVWGARERRRDLYVVWWKKVSWCIIYMKLQNIHIICLCKIWGARKLG